MLTSNWFDLRSAFNKKVQWTLCCPLIYYLHESCFQGAWTRTTPTIIHTLILTLRYRIINRSSNLIVFLENILPKQFFHLLKLIFQLINIQKIIKTYTIIRHARVCWTQWSTVCKIRIPIFGLFFNLPILP